MKRFFAMLLLFCALAACAPDTAPDGTPELPEIRPSVTIAPDPSGPLYPEQSPHLTTENGEYYVEACNYSMFPDPLFEVNVNYPQIRFSENNELETAINELLKNVPFSIVTDDGTYESAVRRFDEMLAEGNSISIEVDYEIIHNDNETISVSFDWFSIYYRMQIYSEKLFVTVDLRTGELVSLEDYADVPALIEKLENKNYEVVEGTYNPGGWKGYEPDIVTDFIEAFKLSLEKKNASPHEYNRYSGTNFCLDRDSLYINFYFYDSLDGYVILKIPM